MLYKQHYTKKLNKNSTKSISDFTDDIKFYLRKSKLNRYRNQHEIADYCYLRAIHKARGLMLLRRSLQNQGVLA